MRTNTKTLTNCCRLGKYTEALSALRPVPGRGETRRCGFQGVVQTEAGKPVDAIATFVKLTQDYPELPEPFNQSGRPSMQARPRQVRAALEMAIRTNPSYATAQETWAISTPNWPMKPMPRRCSSTATTQASGLNWPLIREVFSAPTAKPPSGDLCAGSVSDHRIGLGQDRFQFSRQPTFPQLPAASTPARNVSPAGNAASGAATTSSGNLATGQKQ